MFSGGKPIILYYCRLRKINTYAHFFQMEAKIAFSRLLQKYKVTLPENYKLVAVQRTTNQTKDDVHCTLEHRQK